MELEIKKIMLDGGTQPRNKLNFQVVTEYAEAMKNGEKFPDIVVFFDGSHYWLADGFHRVRAALDAGLGTINADIREGTRRDALLYGISANTDHGLRRSKEDKIRSVRTLCSDEEWARWSINAIAKECKVSWNFVNKLIESEFPHLLKEETKIYERNGQKRIMKTTNIGRRTPTLGSYPSSQQITSDNSSLRSLQPPLKELSEEWLEPLKPLEAKLDRLKGIPPELQEERDEVAERELWEEEQLELGAVERGVWIDPFIANPRTIAEAIDYLAKCYHKKTGKQYKLPQK